MFHDYIYIYIYIYNIYIYICNILHISGINILINIILSIIPSPLFTFVGQCWEKMTKLNCKGSHIINWRKENLKRHFIWYLCKEIRSNKELEQLIFSKEHFYGKHIQKTFVILVNSTKQNNKCIQDTHTYILFIYIIFIYIYIYIIYIYIYIFILYIYYFSHPFFFLLSVIAQEDDEIQS